MRLGARPLTVPLIHAVDPACAGSNPAPTWGAGDPFGAAWQAPDPTTSTSDRSAAYCGVPAGFASPTDDPAKPLAGANHTRD